jgi:AcrR family transcriptional regulator
MENESAAALPGALAAAWGVRGRPGKGPKPGLSLERIVSAAVAIADADGLTAVSMGRVAAKLGASTMSLYRYVASKDELLTHMVDAALGTPPPATDQDWRAGVAEWSRSALASYRGHRWMLDMPIAGLPTMPNEVAWMESALRALRGTGLDETERMSVLLLIAGYVRNQATTQAQIDAAFAAGYDSPDEAMASYSGMLRSLIDERRFPEVSAILASGIADKADGPDAEFVFGLERILDGIDLFVRSRTID